MNKPNQCTIKPNFDKNKHVVTLPIGISEASTVEEVLSMLNEHLTTTHNTSFSMAVEESSDPSNFYESVTDMIETLIDKLDTFSFKNKELSIKKDSNNAKVIKAGLILLANPSLFSTKVDLDVAAVIHPQESQLEKISRSLDYTLGRFFKGYTKNLFKLVLRERLARVTTINLERKTITTDIYSLNSNIEDFLKENYSTLIRYMKKIAPGLRWGNEKNFSTSMFRGHNIIKTLDTYLGQFEDYVEFLRRTGELDELVEEGYNSYVFEEKENTEFLEALFSFITLKHIDSVIRETIGDQISFHKDMTLPNESGRLKYYYGKDVDSRVHGWGVEARDVLRETGAYAKMLISLIKIVDIETKKVIEGEEMRTVDYFQTMTLLTRSIPEFIRFATENKLLDIAQNLRNNLIHLAESPVESMRAIMFTIHEAIDGQFKRRNRSPLLDVLEKIFNAHEIRILESIYQGVFNTANPKSMYMVERLFLEDTGITRAYPIVETLVSLIVASTQKDYSLTIWKNTGYERGIKLKFNTDKMKYELILAMNIENTLNLAENSYSLISKTNIPEGNAREEYVIDIDGTTIKLVIPTGDNTLGLFSETYDGKDIYINSKIYIVENGVDFEILEYLKTIKVNTNRDRKVILSSNSGKNKALKNILKFIDIFTGTSFSAALDGLQRYSLMTHYQKRAVTNMLSTAIRGFYINELNKQYLQKVDEGEYNGIDFDKFISDTHAAFAKIEDLDRKKPTWRSIWDDTTRGLNLKTINSRAEWVSNYSKVLQIMSGEIARSNIKNAEDHSIPNYGLTYEGSNIWLLMESRGYKSLDLGRLRDFLALKTNPFASDPSLILQSTVSEDITLRNGDKKMIKNMTDSELYYNAIVDKFILLLSPDNKGQDRMEIQPTTYSDKTSFINFVVDLSKNNLINLPSKSIENLMIHSIGGMYRSILNKVITDYTTVFPELLLIEGTREKIAAIEGKIKNMTEDELTALFVAKNLKLETDTHFRTISTKVGKNKITRLAFNELLEANALETYTAEGLHSRLELEKKTMVRNLFETLTTFSTKGEGNAILAIYKRFIGEKDFSWQENNLLILAKNELLQPIRSIFELNKAKSITLNPILEKFFIMHSYLGNNLRYILSGNELNHKNKTLQSMNLGNRIMDEFVLSLNNLDPEVRESTYPSIKVNADNEIIPPTFKELLKLYPSLKSALAVRLKSFGEKVTNENLEKLWNSLSFVDLLHLIDNVPTLKSILQNVKSDSLYEVEATSLGAQLKRNVIIPGTMRPYTQGSLRGIPSTFRVAIVNDVAAETFNVNGDVKSNNDAHDGSAWICPITSILENWSLLDNEVGTVKKPIWHDYNGSLGTAVLVKFAAHTITNNIMRLATGGINMYNIFKKMTNTNSWDSFIELGIADGTFETRNILELNAFSGDVITIGQLTGGNALMYKGKEGRIYQINEIEYDEDNEVYYTLESEYDPSTKEYEPEVKVYHYFDENSNHIKSESIIDNPEYHQMHTLFEAYNVFGGLNSGFILDGEFHNSESSLYATAMLTNLVNVETEECDKERNKYLLALDIYYKKKADGEKNLDKPQLLIGLDQKHYNLPLKTLMVDYIINNSAIKNGAGNRNNTQRLYNDEAFDTITLNTQYYGILMDSDHEADEAEMTEFSQVISALDAGGRLHSYVKSIYTALGDMAIRESLNEYDIIKGFLDALGVNDETLYLLEFKTLLNIPNSDKIGELFEKALTLRNDLIKTLFKNAYENINEEAIIPAFEKAKAKYDSLLSDARDKLYTVIGDVLIHNISSRSGQAGLTDSILREIRSRFNLKSSHKLESELKIPFSDPNIYSSILTNFSSLINKKSIRRPYPGIGGVLSPGYDIMMIYDLNGKTYQFSDILTEATEYYNNTVLSIAEAEETTLEEQKILKRFSKLEDIQDDVIWDRTLVRIYLELLRDEYNENKYYYNILEDTEYPDFEYYTETFMPTDRVGIRYRIGGEEEDRWYDINLDHILDYYNFKSDPRAYLQSKLDPDGSKGILVTIKGFRKNIDKARNLAPSKVWWTYTDKLNRLRTKNIYDTEEVRNAFINNDNSKVQSILDQVATGVWNGYQIELHNEPAELIMANIYQTRFNVDADTSLVDILNNKKRTFKENPILQTLGIVDRNFYDFIMLKNNGKHSYISFNRHFDKENEDTITYKQLSWGRKQRQAPYSNLTNEEKSKVKINSKIVNDVYVMDSDNRPMFMIGRDIERDDIKYDKTKGEFYLEKNNTREVLDNRNLTWDGNRVIEYVEFVTSHLYKKTAQVNNTDITKNHQVYNINTAEFARTFGERTNDLENEAYYDQLRDILKLIYLADSYECFTLNDKQYSIYNSNLIRNLMNGMHLKFLYDGELSNFLFNLYDRVIKNNMITPTKKEGKWSFEIKGSKHHLGLIHLEGSDAVLVGKAFYAKEISNITKDYYKKLAKRKKASFMRSLRYTASRIPAQTLQSFMLMKLVGFTGETTNYSYVSHWQTWLQGSDYDIDKAYIMGLAFDDNGSYIGWSNLFDYYDIDTLYLSEQLPLPLSNRKLTEAETGIDINEELSKLTPIIKRLRDKNLYISKSESDVVFNEKKDRIDRLNIYLKIFEKLGENTIISPVKSNNIEALKELESHFNTKYPPGRQSQILRNYISSHIQASILNVRNLKDSYIPVEMEDLRDAADSSPKGQDAKTITLVNPLSIYKMLRQNMIGKQVIGIAATGQKASFMLSFYMNEVYKNAKKGIDYEFTTNNDGTSTLHIIPGSKLEEALFSFTSDRLIPNETHTVKALPDLKENVVLDLKDYVLTHKLNPKNPVDIMISLLISAATDNAKELILDKINAGDNLAKCFLFGIVVGCDIKTLVEFMTSQVLSWISTLANTNVYTERNKSVKAAIRDVTNHLNKIVAYINSLNTDTPLAYPNSILNMIIPTNLTIDLVNHYLEDILEFKNLLEAANEFSSLGRILSVNLGIKTRAEDLEITANNIQRIIADREESLGIVTREGQFSSDMFATIVGKDKLERYESVISSNFDSIRWLLDRDVVLKDGSTVKYRALTAEYYNYIKKNFNIFGVINSTPHFNKMFTLMGSVFTVHLFSTRTRIVLEAVKLYKDINPGKYLDSAGYSLILGAANDVMLIKFFEESGILFPVKKDYPCIKSDGVEYRIKADSTIDLSTDDGRAKFKYLFDNYIVPKLKSGTFFTADSFSNPDGKYTYEELEARASEYNSITSNNEFISALMKGKDKDVPLWKTDIDMASDTSYSLLRIAKFGKALMELHSIKIGNKYSIADWFAIYNFITNKNQYGSDRLTKAFESFMTTFNSKKASVINDYFEFVGNIDYKGKNVLEYFDVSIYDMLMLSARVTNDLDHATGLMVVKDLEYYVKQSPVRGDYHRFGKVVQTDSSLTLKQLIDKYLTRRSYYTLSKPYSDFINRVIYLLNSDRGAYKALAFLMQRGNLEIQIDCK